MAKIKTKGYISYGHKENGDFTINTDLYDKPKNINAYNKISFNDFLEKVQSFSVSDYDGYIANIIVNERDTNLGLDYKNVHSGGNIRCTVDELKSLTRGLSVIINWANQN